MKYVVKGEIQKTFCTTVEAETKEEAIEKAKIDFSYNKMKFSTDDLDFYVVTKEEEDLNQRLFWLDLERQLGTKFVPKEWDDRLI